MKRRKESSVPEYVVICREFDRASAQIVISVIESDVTDHLLQGLIRLRMRDTNKRYFLTTKKNYQKYGALLRKQVETMSIQMKRIIVELGPDLSSQLHVVDSHTC